MKRSAARASLSASLLCMDILASWCAQCPGLSGRTTVLITSVKLHYHTGRCSLQLITGFTAELEDDKDAGFVHSTVNFTASSEGETFALIRRRNLFWMAIDPSSVGCRIECAAHGILRSNANTISSFNPTSSMHIPSDARG
ncbi:hypothetical protein DFH94DRAFT_103428 [Russula ochroleuca]|uniref:Secreted protein n=1 Tax=Russula ochroleuca TaxID=152965 RepID=A0A9P5MSD9_9AGAM|nr:hypothetical protein DFH94DRAFT_103428 [Russula ochroleuca]